MLIRCRQFCNVNNDFETLFVFDNQYYQNCLVRKRLFQTDLVLLVMKELGYNHGIILVHYKEHCRSIVSWLCSAVRRIKAMHIKSQLGRKASLTRFLRKINVLTFDLITHTENLEGKNL